MTGYAHARYRELLYQHGHGYPFWIPEPDAHLPSEQRSEGLRLGDVGILTDDGGFDYLWNIHLPGNHPHNTLAPPNFKPVVLDTIHDVRRTDLFSPRNTAINSTFVKKREISIEAELAVVGGVVGGGVGFEFTAEGNSGAVLTLPRGGVRFNSLKLNLYLRHATENAESWYRHINQVLQRGIQSGALYLVTGTDKCSSWGVASIANPSGSHGLTLKFVASEVASSDVSVRNSWSASFGVEHRENVVDRSELSQCVFARGFVISVRDSFFAQICGMQVKVTSLDGSRGRPPFVGSNRPYSRGADSNTNIDVQRLPDNQPQKSVAALLGEELLNQNEDALIAIVHDDDWIGSMRSGDFLQARDGGGSFLDDLVHHAATHSHAVVVNGICTFAAANLMAPSDGGDGSSSVSTAGIGSHEEPLHATLEVEEVARGPANLADHVTILTEKPAQGQSPPTNAAAAAGNTDGLDLPFTTAGDSPVAMYRSSKDQFIEKLNTLLSDDPVLERFFKDDQNYIPELAMKAVELETDMTSALGSSELLPKTVKVTLYQQVIHCDDSWLMNIDNRWAALAELVKRIAKVTTRVLPKEEGVALRFANQAVDESLNLSLQQISNIFESRAWSLEGSATAIRSLQPKVLQPLVYSKLADRSLRRPLLVSVLVAGVPSGDMNFPLLYIIKDCGDKLQAAGYPRKSVRFMISQFGAADDATPFFSELRSNKEVADVVFVSSDPLDKRLAALEASETELDRWMMETLFSAIEEKEDSV